MTITRSPGNGEAKMLGGLVSQRQLDSVLIFVAVCSSITLIPRELDAATLHDHVTQAEAANPDAWSPPLQDRVEPFFTTTLSQPPSKDGVNEDETSTLYLGDAPDRAPVSPQHDYEYHDYEYIEPRYTFTPPGFRRGIPECFFEIDQDCIRQQKN